jgi:hypothetical protein
MKNDLQPKKNISQTLFGLEFETSSNQVFMQHFNKYQQTKDIYQRVQLALGRTKSYKVQNSSSLNVKLNTSATASTI